MSVYLLTFFFVAIAWADFDFPPLVIIFMCLILDLSMMSLAYDKVVPSALPNKWNLTKIIGIAIVLACVAAAGSLLFLSFLRSGHEFTGVSTWQQGKDIECGYPYVTHSGVRIDEGNPNGHCFQNGTIVTGSTLNVEFADSKCTQNFKDDYTSKGVNLKVFESLSILNHQLAPAIQFPLPFSCHSLTDNSNDKPSHCHNINREAVYYYEPNLKKIPTVGYLDGWNNTNANPDSDLGYSTESGANAHFDPRYFPYSSAVENSIMFLQLSLSSLFTVLSARVDGWFFIRRPGYVLLAIISTVMVVITFAVGVMRAYPFWFPNINYKFIRLTAVDGRYIGLAWLFSILLFLFMECAKWVVYKTIELQRINEIAARKRMRLKEELRRRMTRRTPGFRATVSNNSAHDLSLAPRSTSQVSRKVVSNNSYDDQPLNQPLLVDDDYAG